jgi:hypothetical protein
MRFLIVTILAALISGVTIEPSRAEANAGLALEMYDRGGAEAREQFELAILMINNGFEWANAELTEQRKTRPLYCALAKLGLYEGTSPKETGPQ